MTDLYRDGFVTTTGHKQVSIPCLHRAELDGSWSRAVPLAVLSQLGTARGWGEEAFLSAANTEHAENTFPPKV